MQRFFVILEGKGGVLDTKEITVPAGDDPDEAVNLAAHEAMETWILSVGDTIKIREPGEKD